MLSDTCCFTGHRKLPENSVPKITSTIKKEIVTLISNGVTNFVCGGAIGFDTLCGKEVIKLREAFPSIKLILALPCIDQNKYFTDSQNEDYYYLKKNCNELHFVSEKYTQNCMLKRNRFMVDMSGTVIAYCTKNTGGTFYTIKYATQKSRNIIHI